MIHFPYKSFIFLVSFTFIAPVFGLSLEKVDVTVGMEGIVIVDLPEPDIKSVPIDESADLILRIGNVTRKGDSYIYELYYIGMVPGRHDLREYLLNKDDTQLADVDPIYVDVKRKLPEKHNGMLTKVNPSQVTGVIWYSPLMVGVVLLWVVLLFPLIFYKRRKKKIVAPPIPLPTIAEKLQPLVIKASEGELTLEEKAHIEDLMMLYWCKELDLDMKDLVGSLLKIKKHEEAGKLIYAMESWLHKPPGKENIDVQNILAPYREIIQN